MKLTTHLPFHLFFLVLIVKILLWCWVTSRPGTPAGGSRSRVSPPQNGDGKTDPECHHHDCKNQLTPLYYLNQIEIIWTSNIFTFQFIVNLRGFLQEFTPVNNILFLRRAHEFVLTFQYFERCMLASDNWLLCLGHPTCFHWARKTIWCSSELIYDLIKLKLDYGDCRDFTKCPHGMMWWNKTVLWKVTPMSDGFNYRLFWSYPPSISDWFADF